ncbi:hypothetical protein GCM10010954_04290 [Halobacillus andaensis]|uniref:DUF309 domain-containing protein n=1 Tax=Halobacillus andaensis TaxID=1176239 RepID=A0A917AZN4_HALAA|nr:DUF309 domain-containing protein [Halobacillus andaensis]MBP2003219.1 putative metal-dependent hydrolase [Halobacillus andaensis]GGF08956.1 hypothetical protein GCM10010954_04290 [Halobacillus andaensis]
MYPKSYIEFLAHFHGTRDYFECHEVLEEYWKEVEPGCRNSVWVLFIQFAVTLYHYRRGNLKGALILINKTIEKLPSNYDRIYTLGINAQELHKLSTSVKNNIERKAPYKSVMLPINEPELQQYVKRICIEWNVPYGQPSDLSDEKLIHRHIKWNRT